uniref:Uncharacterized protein n=1 Tax=Chromera velia CCMP2878 TaxID=1169474 RepID=A0A0G4I4V7_9ALVE|eukprot:Cvel_1818.t1-p1 / transcript=Cvel_1818.t1 / gene=Cvel_1818 / organism=Chromera_velia_CCMP2878 / gene_product=Microtubule-associated protein futsch, putative / transcript_product=Microtubule-associated protein futsch, putative / location=Cvel_scaffold67:45627-50460(+) / protein_length=1286 / sequence_SO=supercontig / SO=protein_coding / is_pseudo=false
MPLKKASSGKESHAKAQMWQSFAEQSQGLLRDPSNASLEDFSRLVHEFFSLSLNGAPSEALRSEWLVSNEILEGFDDFTAFVEDPDAKNELGVQGTVVSVHLKETPGLLFSSLLRRAVASHQLCRSSTSEVESYALLVISKVQLVTALRILEVLRTVDREKLFAEEDASQRTLNRKRRKEAIRYILDNDADVLIDLAQELIHSTELEFHSFSYTILFLFVRSISSSNIDLHPLGSALNELFGSGTAQKLAQVSTSSFREAPSITSRLQYRLSRDYRKECFRSMQKRDDSAQTVEEIFSKEIGIQQGWRSWTEIHLSVGMDRAKAVFAQNCQLDAGSQNFTLLYEDDSEMPNVFNLARCDFPWCSVTSCEATDSGLRLDLDLMSISKCEEHLEGQWDWLNCWHSTVDPTARSSIFSLFLSTSDAAQIRTFVSKLIGGRRSQVAPARRRVVLASTKQLSSVAPQENPALNEAHPDETAPSLLKKRKRVVVASTKPASDPEGGSYIAENEGSVHSAHAEAELIVGLERVVAQKSEHASILTTKASTSKTVTASTSSSDRQDKTDFTEARPAKRKRVSFSDKEDTVFFRPDDAPARCSQEEVQQLDGPSQQKAAKDHRGRRKDKGAGAEDTASPVKEAAPPIPPLQRKRSDPKADHESKSRESSADRAPDEGQRRSRRKDKGAEAKDTASPVKEAAPPIPPLQRKRSDPKADHESKSRESSADRAPDEGQRRSRRKDKGAEAKDTGSPVKEAAPPIPPLQRKRSDPKADHESKSRESSADRAPDEGQRRSRRKDKGTDRGWQSFADRPMEISSGAEDVPSEEVGPSSSAEGQNQIGNLASAAGVTEKKAAPPSLLKRKKKDLSKAPKDLPPTQKEHSVNRSDAQTSLLKRPSRRTSQAAEEAAPTTEKADQSPFRRASAPSVTGFVIVQEFDEAVDDIFGKPYRHSLEGEKENSSPLESRKCKKKSSPLESRKSKGVSSPLQLHKKHSVESPLVKPDKLKCQFSSPRQRGKGGKRDVFASPLRDVEILTEEGPSANGFDFLGLAEIEEIQEAPLQTPASVTLGENDLSRLFSLNIGDLKMPAVEQKSPVPKARRPFGKGLKKSQVDVDLGEIDIELGGFGSEASLDDSVSFRQEALASLLKKRRKEYAQKIEASFESIVTEMESQVAQVERTYSSKLQAVRSRAEKRVQELLSKTGGRMQKLLEAGRTVSKTILQELQSLSHLPDCSFETFDCSFEKKKLQKVSVLQDCPSHSPSFVVVKKNALHLVVLAENRGGSAKGTTRDSQLLQGF